MITRFWAMRAIASLPSSSSLLRNIALSIAIVYLNLCAKVRIFPYKNGKKTKKYHVCGM
jgi:hypothetical protein